MPEFRSDEVEVVLRTNVSLEHLTHDEKCLVFEDLRSLPDVLGVDYFDCFVEVGILLHAKLDEEMLMKLNEARRQLAEAFSRLNLPTK